LLCLLLLALSSQVTAESVTDQGFQQWLQSFYPVAAKEGIHKSTWDKAFAGVTAPDRDVLRKAAFQPEFTTEIWDYLDTRVNSKTVSQGRIMAGLHQKTLADIEIKYGIPSSVILAIWSLESSYGKALESPERMHYVPQALATLAYADKRRKKFARKQLIASLKIVQAGDAVLDQFMGSWAGAMGHTQFIPTSYLVYGVDMDKDGRRDIWNSVADALATAANLLKKNGWRTGRTWGIEVQMPANGKKMKNETRTLGQWQKLGFHRADGATFTRPGEKAVLKLIGTGNGPGFLMLRNFFIIKRYNNSDYYALAVGLLSDRLAHGKGMMQPWPRPAGALNIEEKFTLQELLREKGYYSGAVDGDLGSNTRKGIKMLQHSQGLPPDGEPNLEILELLRREHD
jgi:membrane-bound lytic murein transglycosylase B